MNPSPQDPPPFAAADVPPPPYKSSTTPALKSPKRSKLASSSTHKEETLVSLPSQRGGGMGASPLYCPTPVNRLMYAQPLSQSGLAAASTLSMAGTMSASGLSSDTKSKDIPRKHPLSTPGTTKVHVAEDNGYRRFPSTVRTVLSDNIRYAPRRCLITCNCYNCL